MKFAYLILFIFCIKTVLFATPNDSITYAKDPYYIKLAKLKSEVPIFYDEKVKKNIQNYIRNTDNSTALLIGKTQYYYNLYVNHFAQQGIPTQLFLLSAINSDCNPSYIGNDGASGQWALSYAMAKKYNLTTNSYVDERRNPEKSTQAAAHLLKDLQIIYVDWLKSIAAFRSGPINLNMAIRRANNSMDYKKIHPFLTSEYQNTVAEYMAFWYIWNYYNDYRIVPIKYRMPESDTVHIQKEISLSSIAFHLNLSEELLKQYNSELRIGIVPEFYNSKGVRIPKDKITEYHQKLDILFPKPVLTNDSLSKDTILLMNENITKPKPIEPETNSNTKLVVKGETTIIYTVKSGDGLLLLADLFDCRVSDIKSWNGMKKDAIYRGQKLKIRVPKAKQAEYKKINSLSATQKKKLAKRS